VISRGTSGEGKEGRKEDRRGGEGIMGVNEVNGAGVPGLLSSEGLPV